MNILIVDDDLELLSHLSKALERKHYRVETAQDGEKALDKIFEIPMTLFCWISCCPAWMD